MKYISYNIFYPLSWSLNVVIKGVRLRRDNKTNLVFMMRLIITRQTESTDGRRAYYYLLWLAWSRVASIINNVGREDFLSRPVTSQVDTFSIFSFSNLIHSLLTCLERKYIVRTKLYNFVRFLTYFVNFHNSSNICILIQTFNKEPNVYSQTIFYPENWENAIQSFKLKLLSLTYWYSKLLQNIVAQFQPRKLCQESDLFLGSNIQFKSSTSYSIYLSAQFKNF